MQLLQQLVPMVPQPDLTQPQCHLPGGKVAWYLLENWRHPLLRTVELAAPPEATARQCGLWQLMLALALALAQVQVQVQGLGLGLGLEFRRLAWLAFVQAAVTCHLPACQATWAWIGYPTTSMPLHRLQMPWMVLRK